MCAKSKYPAWKPLLSSVRWGGNVGKRKAPWWIFSFSQVAVKQSTLHHLYFLIDASVPHKYPQSHSQLSQLPHSTTTLFCMHSATADLFLHWCITRQADRNGETVKHFHNRVKVLSQFRACCANTLQYNNRHGRQQKIFQWVQRRNFAYPLQVAERCNANGRSQKALSFLPH